MGEPTTADIMAAIADLKTHVDAKIDSVRAEMTAGFKEVRAEMAAEFKEARADLAHQGQRLANIDGQLLQIGLRISDVDARLPVPIAYQPPTKAAG